MYRRNNFTSTFETAATEQAYLKSRLHDMHKGICFCGILMGSLLLLLGMRHMWDATSIHIRHYQYMASSIICFAIAGAMRMPITNRLFGFRQCECVVMVVYLTVLVTHVPFSQPWIDPEKVGSDTLKMWEFSTILNLDTVVTCVHLALPVRWKVIVWGDILYLIGLIVRGFLKPDPYGDLNFATAIGLTFAALVCGASWGLRIQECTQRDLFSLVIHERTKKAQAEFEAGSKRQEQGGNLSAGNSSAAEQSVVTFDLTVSEARPSSLSLSSLSLSETTIGRHSESSSKPRRPRPPMQSMAERRELVNVETQTTDTGSAAAEADPDHNSSDVGAGSAARPSVSDDGRPPMMPQLSGEPRLLSARRRAAHLYQTGGSDSSSRSDSSSPPGLAHCVATTPMGQLTAILTLMDMIYVKRKSCCPLHSNAAVIYKWAKKLKTGKCDRQWECHSKWQCSFCTCLLNYEPDVCIVCGTASMKTAL